MIELFKSLTQWGHETPENIRCPGCSGKLSAVGFKGVTTDICPKGCGVWFDFGEMYEVSDKGDLAEIDTAFPGEPAKPTSETDQCTLDSPRTCPRDGNPLVREEFRVDSGIVMDLCPQCAGSWLDAGEIETYEAHLSDLEENPVPFEVIRNRLETQWAINDAEIDEAVLAMNWGSFDRLIDGLYKNNNAKNRGKVFKDS